MGMQMGSWIGADGEAGIRGGGQERDEGRREKCRTGQEFHPRHAASTVDPKPEPVVHARDTRTVSGST
jgi:hypothetical protein